MAAVCGSALLLSACGDDGGVTTITSTAEGIDGEVADDEGSDRASDGAGTSGDDEGSDGASDAAGTSGDDDPDGAAPEGAVDGGPSGSVTVDGVDHVLERIDRCVPTDQTTERIEAVDGIDSLETLNLVATGDAGMLEVYYSDAGVRSVTFAWDGDGGSLEVVYSQVAAGADWLDGQGNASADEPLGVVDGSAVGGATVDARQLSFELPIPAEPSC